MVEKVEGNPTSMRYIYRLSDLDVRLGSATGQGVIVTLKG